MKNQCDGCQAGIPCINGAHKMGSDKYPDTMRCQASKYAPLKEDNPELLESLPDLAESELVRLELRDCP